MTRALLILGALLVLVGLWTCSESYSFKFSMTGMLVLGAACFYDATRPRDKRAP